MELERKILPVWIDGLMSPRGTSPWVDAASVLPDGVDIVFDVGANVGQTATQLRTAFPKAEIFCFEPVPATFRQLQLNAASLDRVKCVPLALSNRKGVERMFLQLDSTWNSLSDNLEQGLGSVEVELDTIDNFCAERQIAHIDILKSDTEGHDLHVLQGAYAMLSQGRLDAIYTEVGFYKEDKGHTNFCAVLEFLKAVKFQFFGLYDFDGIKFIEHHEQPCFPWTNALFVRNELISALHGTEYARWLASLRHPSEK